MTLEDLYLVRCFHGINFTDFYVVKIDLMRFIRATYKLHVNPGKNPHSGNECLRYNDIYVYDMNKPSEGQFWWTTPSLHADGTGARIVNFDTCVRHWNFKKVA